MTAHDDRRRKAVETALRRRVGMEPARAAALREAVLSHDDLYATCRRCGFRRRGNLAAVTAPCPRCGFPENTP